MSAATTVSPATAATLGQLYDAKKFTLAATGSYVIPTDRNGPSPLIGGYNLDSTPNANGTYSRCTLGFYAKRSNSVEYVTAGHCGNTTIHGGVTIGAVDTNTFTDNSVADAESIGSETGGEDFVYLQDPAPPQEASVRIVGYKSTQELMGEAVCKSGRTTGYSCFTTTAVHMNVPVGNYLILDMVRARSGQVPPAIDGGDSGGPVIVRDAYDTVGAEGIVSAKGDTSTMFYSFIGNVELALNVTVQTGGG